MLTRKAETQRYLFRLLQTDICCVIMNTANPLLNRLQIFRNSRGQYNSGIHYARAYVCLKCTYVLENVGRPLSRRYATAYLAAAAFHEILRSAVKVGTFASSITANGSWDK